MREILFRGKRLDSGGWEYGYLHNGFIGTMIIDPDGIVPDGGEYGYGLDKYCLVDPATVGQFTGLCDKDGVKIFEGDKLTTDLFRPYVVVIFRDGCFMFNCNDGGKDYWDIMLPIMKEAQTQTLYHEVIGNIHDTPDLAKEESE